jgi:membrane protein
MFRRLKTFLAAIYELYEQSGFTLAGAVAFAFLLSLFPFCIFLGALAGVFGGRGLAEAAVGHLFEVLPQSVAEALAPEVTSIMGNSRIDLATYSAGFALFFATSAIETLRAALNGAYRVQETRPYLLCLGLSMLFVLISAASMLVLTWALIVAPALIARLEPDWLSRLPYSSWVRSALFSTGLRYGVATLLVAGQLCAMHLWLAAGRRTFRDVLPGVAFSVFLFIATAALYSVYLDLSDYTKFYAGLSQLMIALIFFQVTAIIVILGAELNRGLIELRKFGNGAPRNAPIGSGAG